MAEKKQQLLNMDLISSFNFEDFTTEVFGQVESYIFIEYMGRCVSTFCLSKQVFPVILN